MLESWETGEAESSQDVNNKTKIKKQEQENTEEIKRWKEMKIKWNKEWFFKASLVCLSLITFSSSHFRQASCFVKTALWPPFWLKFLETKQTSIPFFCSKVLLCQGLSSVRDDS